MANAAPTKPSAVSAVQSSPRALSRRPSSTTAARPASTSSRRPKTSGPPRSTCTTQTRASAGSRSKNERIAHKPPRTRSRQPRPPKLSRSKLPLDRSQRIVEQRPQARLTVLEQLIERTPGHPRTRSDVLRPWYSRNPAPRSRRPHPPAAASAGSRPAAPPRHPHTTPPASDVAPRRHPRAPETSHVCAHPALHGPPAHGRPARLETENPRPHGKERRCAAAAPDDDGGRLGR